MYIYSMALLQIFIYINYNVYTSFVRTHAFFFHTHSLYFPFIYLTKEKVCDQVNIKN